MQSEVRQFELLTSIDALRQRLEQWIQTPSDWEPVQQGQLLLRRVVDRVETLRIRMESPLVVATFGGTGTGKSTLVNALVGEEVTRSGRQRPTTSRPVLIVHSEISPQSLGIPLDAVEVVQRDSELLRDVVLLDCPDPDTTEEAGPESNLERLRTLLPFCDVLIYVSTQQKYRSARVSDELKSAAAGCRIVFVQTHAGIDEDIRTDWENTLSGEYEVPQIFFVDSLRALQEQQQGRRPSGDMGRLLDLLHNKLGASERVRVRRANVLEMVLAGLERCEALIQTRQPALQELQQVLLSQQAESARRLAGNLQQELVANHRLWERRLTSAVIDQWGISPFSLVLRIYNGLGNILASTALFRARSTAQLALIGTVQGVRWLESRRQENAASTSLERLSQAGLDDALLQESELIIRGYLTSAGFDRRLTRPESLEQLRSQAALLESRFLGNASQQIEEIIHEQSQTKARWWPRLLYEVVLSAYLLFVLARVGKSFFVDSFLYNTPLLNTDFYLAASLFLVLICGLLIGMFNWRLQQGLKDRIRRMTDRLIQIRLSGGIFPQLESAVRDARQRAEELTALTLQTRQLRAELAEFQLLGGRQRAAPVRIPGL